IANYCPRCGTSYSQLEINYVEKDDDLYYLDYKTIVIATTRPETIFADVAVAVNPKDKRYKKLIGETAKIPLVNRNVPIIEDNMVDKEYGTGALKITPAHDATDFEIGQTNNLPLISVIDETGRMTNAPKKYVGKKAEVAREEVVADLKKAGIIKKTEKIHHAVGTCYRDHGIIEPMVSKQWYIKVKPLTKLALTAISKKEVRFVAKKYQKIAIHWLKNLKDWNISRQIVWGIRIPAWRCQKCMQFTITDGEVPKVCTKCKNSELLQDNDTFDTWFSSGQWPFATLQTTKPNDFSYFYPTSVMDPSYDILPFWVIRMLMLGPYKTKQVPFRNVLLHGLVRDKHGVKISKSKGNVIDPIDMINKYGADALRVALIWGSLVENDNSVSEENINGQRKFANKVWNVARFVLDNHILSKPKQKITNPDDKWILSELNKTNIKVTKSLDEFRLNEAAEEIYDFIWHKFADVYIESTKTRRDEAQPTLLTVLNTSLKLLHPFMPFVTETIWQEAKNEKLLINESWPKKI
ncbi:valine--tRNA ligase, partial [Patescibacteria group bacterium]